ncbi:PREDICTED: arginine decarboxylase 2 isoform X2 [Camelina sativa]|uniref:Arginine decarboxylase n=1 Tax=Camelina sativa TaxID=90675 RepID=A0ABM0UVP5_CAMSA|nr:PREDICTED: arginine decarboxylase 2 isoform X2 [Camelina sativa]
MPALACVCTSFVPPSYAFSNTTAADVFIPASSPTSAAQAPLSTCAIPASSPTSAAAASVVDSSRRWSSSLSSSLYRIDGWGAPYFVANPSGNISVRPHGSETLPHQDVDLLKIVKKVTDPKSSGGLGLQLPLIVRFPDVLKNRLECLQSAFDFAIQSQGYGAHYQGVYPVKCNQDRFVVEDIVKFGSSFRFGLEAGSKPEILLAMSCLCKGNPDAFLVCNGFKDAEYVSLALLGRKLALNSVIVLEQEEELDLVIELSQKMNVRPVIGLRAKLRTKHSGHFGSTSGEKGKFGLTTTQIVRVVRRLSESGMLDCLQLLHFHIGSQIPSTSLLSDGVSEAAQLYCELVRLGANMKVFDIGGGLGIDYDGSKSGDSDLSVAYTLEEYAEAVVASVRFVCDRRSVKHPVICSESGRAIVSHHSVLIFEAVSVAKPMVHHQETPNDIQFLLEGDEEALANYEDIYAALMRGDRESCLLYVDQLKQRCVKGFKEGVFSIEQLASVDGLCEWVLKAIGASDPVHTYNINLSVFTSIPDLWGIDQLFPIVPIHKLDQRPGARGIFSDLTCDSDGKINKFIGGETSLPLHELDNNGSGGRYFLGMFLGGAYEEALGGFHNLFGGPSVVRVSQSDGPHSFAVTRAVPGQSSADVLRLMQHEPELMFQTLKHRAEEMMHTKSSSDEDEVEEEDDDNEFNDVAACLDRSFHNMPYLATEQASPSNSLSAAINNLGFYYCEEDSFDYLSV